MNNQVGKHSSNYKVQKKLLHPEMFAEDLPGNTVLTITAIHFFLIRNGDKETSHIFIVSLRCVNHAPGMIAVKMCFIGTIHQLSMGDTRQKIYL